MSEEFAFVLASRAEFVLTPRTREIVVQRMGGLADLLLMNALTGTWFIPNALLKAHHKHSGTDETVHERTRHARVTGIVETGIAAEAAFRNTNQSASALAGYNFPLNRRLWIR
jgi:hypothetical protein